MAQPLFAFESFDDLALFNTNALIYNAQLFNLLRNVTPIEDINQHSLR